VRFSEITGNRGQGVRFNEITGNRGQGVRFSEMTEDRGQARWSLFDIVIESIIFKL
jgi:hypothetical protein